jgi:hypothetical protein
MGPLSHSVAFQRSDGVHSKGGIVRLWLRLGGACRRGSERAIAGLREKRRSRRTGKMKDSVTRPARKGGVGLLMELMELVHEVYARVNIGGEGARDNVKKR